MTPTPRNGDIYLFEAPTYLVSAAGDPRTSTPTVEFSAIQNLPLVLFCGPSSWRNHLDQVAVDQGVSLNVALEADSLSLQTNLTAAGGIYTLLGPNAVAAASKTCRLGSSRIIAPTINRYVALATSSKSTASIAGRAVTDLIRKVANSDIVRGRQSAYEKSGT